MNVKSLHGGGGAERRFLRVFTKMSNRQDISVELVINSGLYESAKELNLISNSDKIKLYKDRSRFNFFWFSLFAIRTIIEEKPKVVHLVLIQKTLFLLYFFLFFKRKKYNVKVVSTIASYLFAYDINLKFSDKLIYKLLLSCSDYIDSLYSNIKLKSKKIFCTPCSFTDYDKFSPSDKKDIIVFSGRLIRDKNPLLYLETINEIVNVRKFSKALSWKYYIFGDGPLKNDLESYVTKKNLSDLIVFDKGDTSRVLKKSKIFVSLQQHENYPSQSLLEAIGTKNAIIATDVGDTRKIVNEKYSKLIKPNKTCLADAIINLIENERELDTKAEKAMNETIKNHNIKRFLEYLIDLWTK
ncbi:MAG: glycosyltransferase family 4 protein [Halanaerobiales bacterium]|nr:glycosyltransferase family 4 protein [Halanaerobiales bacterium]